MSDTDDGPVLFRRSVVGLPRKRIRAFAERLEAEVAGGRRFECLLTNDRELRRLNRDFLAKDYPTDVLSFPSPDRAEYLGEIAISVERAAEQARDFGHGVDQEIGILMLHGLLHLLGMDHVKDRGGMARTEARWRRKLDLPPALIERSRS